MHQSHIVEIDGVFVGAALRQSDGYRFVAVDERLRQLNGSMLPTLSDLRRLARQALRREVRPAVRPLACPPETSELGRPD
jgi:hypothetical protein